MSAEETDKPDEPEVPVLRNVVDPSELDLTDHAKTAASPETTQPEDLIPGMREAIAEQLKTELQPIIDTAIRSAVEQATGEIRKILLDELQGSLQNRMRHLLDEALEREYGK